MKRNTLFQLVGTTALTLGLAVLPATAQTSGTSSGSGTSTGTTTTAPATSTEPSTVPSTTTNTSDNYNTRDRNDFDWGWLGLLGLIGLAGLARKRDDNNTVPRYREPDEVSSSGSGTSGPRY
jgi:hypothetical protein